MSPLCLTSTGKPIQFILFTTFFIVVTAMIVVIVICDFLVVLGRGGGALRCSWGGQGGRGHHVNHVTYQHVKQFLRCVGQLV